MRNAISILTLVALSANLEAATKMYKWVDAQGRISYQDKPPPKNSKILSEETLGDSKPSAKKSKKDKKERNTSSIDVYVTENCSDCDTVIDLLKTWGVPHQVKNIGESRDIQGILIEQTRGVGVPALFSGRSLITNTSSIDDLKKRLSSTGHIDLDAIESDSAEESEETQEIQSN